MSLDCITSIISKEGLIECNVNGNGAAVKFGLDESRTAEEVKRICLKCDVIGIAGLYKYDVSIPLTRTKKVHSRSK